MEGVNNMEEVSKLEQVYFLEISLVDKDNQPDDNACFKDNEAK
jgi:hypothetical protein